MKKRLKKISTTQNLILSFAVVILAGACLLCLPIASRERVWTPFLDCLFTATSATCVTGLVVRDTYSYWSAFGKTVILCMIQIGGLGLMSFLTVVGMIMRRKISLKKQRLMSQAIASFSKGEILRHLKKVVAATLLCEAAGALLLLKSFVPAYGTKQGILTALFVAISAFCNAGFDIMPGEYTSLTAFADDVWLNVVIMALIIIGGLGFLVWDDIIRCRFNFRKLHLHSRIVIVASAALILIPTVLYWIFERNCYFAAFNVPLGKQWLYCLFQSVTTRTAGFNTIDLSQMSDSSTMLTTLLMLIGGSPGSTAGGIKTTTFVVLLFSIFYANRSNPNMTIGKKRISPVTTRQACSIFMFYISAIFAAAMIILHCMNQTVHLREVLFECTSAIATVGLGTGITPLLGMIPKMILIILMFSGRLGALTILLLFREEDDSNLLERPIEEIIIG